MKAVFLTVSPYADDALALPVADVTAAIPYYEQVFGFRLVKRNAAPHAAAVLARDRVEIGIAENGGDPTQEGCFFEVDNLDAAFEELTASGAKPGVVDEQVINGQPYRVFFVIAPDGLCYMIAQRR
jgi:catechol 2,3-dioxygenase-like lactoylglutathione lyase family enzyme